MGQVERVASQVIGSTTRTLEDSEIQTDRTRSVVAAINQLGAAAQEIASNASHASVQAGTARAQSLEGRAVVDRNIEAMTHLSTLIASSGAHIGQLNGKTEDIGQILEVISAISQQTNLLALNAAIEAARAGEAGRGFAVVADEVRNLAHRTQQSAQQVKLLIEELQNGAGAVVDAMAQSQSHSGQSVEIARLAGQSLAQVIGSIEQMDGMNQSVAAATEEQSAVVDALQDDISEIERLNQAGTEQMRSTLDACAKLRDQVQNLTSQVERFRV
ncbi:methyl-accepting chemotaxis protein [Pseudomonas sp. NPDC089392]|uniref:methyl-accepting chemotaxis protein n=1 Tax=Pseudomonas sp. NPDC089392 TaxID=3364459 RepID=UPI003801C5F8